MNPNKSNPTYRVVDVGTMNTPCTDERLLYLGSDLSTAVFIAEMNSSMNPDHQVYLDTLVRGEIESVSLYMTERKRNLTSSKSLEDIE